MIFDQVASQRINSSRLEVLDHLLTVLSDHMTIETALDCGCGVGYFSEHLAERGLGVTAFDARAENVKEARRRYPHLNVLQHNLEDRDCGELGRFDLVLCVGVFYHLEHPIAAARNLGRMCQRVLILESRIEGGSHRGFSLVDEPHQEDQALHGLAMVPTRSALIALLRQSGFRFLYEPIPSCRHEEFEGSWFQHPRRLFLVAAREPLDSARLRRVPSGDATVRSFRSRSKRILSGLMDVRDSSVRLALRLGLPLKFSFGWWLSRFDAVNLALLSKDGYERAERRFLERYITPGMVCLDLGAHCGVYTLLLSRLVGGAGRVISFEPSSRELDRLRLNLKINRCHNVHTEAIAVGDSASSQATNLFVCQGRETGCNSLVPPEVPDDIETVEVAATSLDRYHRRRQLERVDFIKMDVEGAELGVLRGAQDLLARERPAILCELADARCKPWGHRAETVYDLLTDSGYRWFQPLPDGRLGTHRRQRSFNRNLVALHQDKLATARHLMTGSSAPW